MTMFFVSVVEVPYQGESEVIGVDAGGPTDAILKAAHKFNERYGTGSMVKLDWETARAAGLDGRDVYMPKRPRPLVYFRVTNRHGPIGFGPAEPRHPKELDPDWWNFGEVPKRVEDRMRKDKAAPQQPRAKKGPDRYKSLAEVENDAND